MPTFARERRKTFTHGAIEAFDEGRIELLTSDGHGQQTLRLLQRSPGQLAGHLHHSFLLRAFDHRRDTQLWPHL